MSNNKRSGGMFAGKGFLLALILCAAAIGVTGYLYSKDEPQTKSVSLLETQEDILAAAAEEEDVAVIATQPQSSGVPETTQSTAPTQGSKTVLKTMSPVTGSAITEYSVEALSYNQTTRDWRVHNGVDLAAEEGDPVFAAAAGEVYTTYCDDSMGYTVVVRHQDGYTTRYSSLAENLAVKPGDSVTMGQTIGYASDTAITECTLGAHVHFSVASQDVPMDPAEFLAIGQ